MIKLVKLEIRQFHDWIHAQIILEADFAGQEVVNKILQGLTSANRTKPGPSFQL
jgi:hypothetical protein